MLRDHGIVEFNVPLDTL